MEVHLGAGAVVDLATSDEISSSTKSIVDALSSGGPNPLRFTQMGGRLGQASDPIDLGSPPIGRTWFILSVTATGADPFTTVGGGALFTLCIGDMAAYHPGHVRVPAQPIPTYRTTSSDGLWVHANESVYVLTTLLGVNPIAVNIQVEEWNTADISMTRPGFTPIA